MLIFGAIGAVALWRRWPMFAAFLVWDFFVSLAVYSWAGEKFAWLSCTAAAGRSSSPAPGIAAIGQARGACAGRHRRRRRRALLPRLSSWWVNVDAARPARDARLHAVLEQVKDVADQVLALAESRGPGAPPLTVTVDSAEGATFPYAWYFRHLQHGLHRPAAGQRRAARPPT